MNLKKLKQTGEIATTLTLISLGVILFGTLLGTNKTLQKTAQTILSRAQITGQKCFDTTCKGITDVTTCGAGMVCKNISGSPMINKYRCVVNLTPTCSGEKKECWCPAATSVPSPTGGPTSSLPQPTTSSQRLSPTSALRVTVGALPPRVPSGIVISSVTPTPNLSPISSSCFFQATAEVRDEVGNLVKDTGFSISSDKNPSKIQLINGQYNLPRTDISKVSGLKPNDISNVTLSLDEKAAALWDISDKAGSRYCKDSGVGAFGAPPACPQNADQGDKKTISGIKLTCGANPTYGWIVKKKPSGKINVRVELSNGGDLSDNILYNAAEFREDAVKLAGTLQLTGINNGVTKSLSFLPKNGVVDSVIEDIPTGQYKVSLSNMVTGLRSEYSNEVESSSYDKNGKKQNKWKKVYAHVLEPKLYSETGRPIDTLYVTTNTIPQVRILYNTNPAAGIVYTSNQACQSCQQSTCGSPSKSECSTKPEGSIAGWNTYWCTAKFKKNDNGDAIQKPSDFFKYCKDGEPPPPNGSSTGCYCNNSTSCQSSGGKVEIPAGQNYCRETNDVVCCVGGAKPSDDQRRANRCCNSDTDCNTNFGSNSKCTGSNRDCASGKSCSLIPTVAPTTTIRTPSTPPQGPIPPTLAPACGGGDLPKPFAQQLATSDCQSLVPGQEYSGQCGGAYNIGAVTSNCENSYRPVFKYEIDKTAGAKLTWQRCQPDSRCSAVVVAPRDCTLGEKTFGSCGGVGSTSKCSSIERPQFVCQQVYENGRYVNRFVRDKQVGCSYNEIGECQAYLASRTLARDGVAELYDNRLKACDTNPTDACKNLPLESAQDLIKPHLTDPVSDVVNVCSNSCVACACNAYGPCAVVLGKVLTAWHIKLEFDEAGITKIAEVRGKELLLGSTKEFGPELFKKLVEKQIVADLQVSQITTILSKLSVKKLSELIEAGGTTVFCADCAHKTVEQLQSDVEKQHTYAEKVLGSSLTHFSIEPNEKDNKPTSITLRFCSDSDHCREVTEPVVQKDNTFNANVIFENQNGNFDVNQNQKYAISCTVNFEGGLQSACPRNIAIDTYGINDITIKTNGDQNAAVSKVASSADADLNGDTAVNSIDYSLFLKSSENDNSVQYDINADGVSNAIDLSALIGFLGTSIKTPPLSY